MTVWSHSLSVFDRRRFLRKLCLGLLVVVIITTGFFWVASHIANAAPNTMSFSARLKNNKGTVVADGFYNVRFKLYNQESTGTHLWSETYFDENGATSGQDYRVRVINGYLSVKLGSRTPFLENINWNDTLWLTMDIGGTEQTATPTDWDGEMTPRIQLTATPYSMNSGAVGGKKADQLVQLGQGRQDDSTLGSSIFINKINGGNLVQLQSAGTDVFRIESTGSITLGAATDQTIKVGTSESGVGHNLTISAGQGGDEDSNNGGTLILQGGAASGLDGNGGDVSIDAGAGNGEGSGGAISLGTVNADSITIGNSGSTTTVEGGLHTGNIDTSGANELKLGEHNATGISLGQDTRLETDKTFSVNGDTVIKSGSSDTTNTFKVQNTEGDSQLAVDAANNRVTIGTYDNTGTLLVLDTKISAGDPTGTLGAMYYNANAGKFRCYEAGKDGNEWKDCITPLPISVVPEDNTTTDETDPIAVDGMTFDLAKNTKYYYKFVIIHESSETTTGSGFGVTTPDNLVMSNWCINTTAITSTAAPGLGSYCGTGDASTTTTGIDNPGNHFTSHLEGYIETGNTAGELTLRFKSETNGKEVTVDKKSFGILQIVQ
ncbi:MAG TPA: hypothetical protein PKD19_04000 [Candidatus Saccharibacteria bacterium]|nr:hypothetical protein [Candidatus Saccharibacteria bacterium]HMR38326.1 hypothetical protein [Candidatus Saccharibacteria bacterium]